MKDDIWGRSILVVLTCFLIGACAASKKQADSTVDTSPDRVTADEIVPRDLTVTYVGKANETLSSEQKSVIEAISKSTYGEVKDIFPALTDELTIQVAVDSVYLASGDSGYAMSPTVIKWTVDPSKGDVVEIARTYMRQTLYHEMHHLVRGWTVKDGKPRTSFMDGVIAEGLAVVFERDFAGGKPPTADYPESVADWVAELKALPVDANYSKWMFYNPDDYRVLVGYRVGTYLIDKAIAASGETAVTLVNVSTDEILRMAGEGDI